MRVVAACKALWHGLVAPARVQEATSQTAAAVFALSVLLVAFISVLSAITEASDIQLVAESRILTQTSAITSKPDPGLDLSLQQRQFTAALGGALVVTIISSAALAVLFLVFMRFMTNAPVTFEMALVAVSSTGLIICLDLILSTAGHLIFHTAQVGLHAGAFVSLRDSPMLFTWLQRWSVFSLWQYLAIAVALSTWSGLHARYGLVVGIVVWMLTRLIVGALTFVSWAVPGV